MTSISSRRARDGLDAASDRESSGPSGARSRFDYAKLLRGSATPHRPVIHATLTPQPPPAPLQDVPPDADDRQEQQTEQDDEWRRHEIAQPSQPISLYDPALAARVALAAGPVVSSVLARQQRVLDLVGTLAREMAGFCGDPAIASGENWDVQMRLDERLFPQTTLYLTLSRFTVHLRFDALDSEVKQLLLDHSSMLQRELDATLRAWNEPRDIQLTVW